MRITVFTPAYNRGYIIEKLYRSLQRQSFRDFEWIVVDDGSTDDTQEKFGGFLAEKNDFPIHYIRVANGGKHRAINLGVEKASGELFYIVDSDDHLPDDALAVIDRMERSIPAEERSHFAGVCGQKGFDSEQAIGRTFDGEILDITTLERPAHVISGDKAEVFYTALLRKYPFPTFEGENFITECVVWDKIATNGYKLRFYNHISMICNYLPDGLSAQGNALFQNNPRGWGLYIHQSVQYGKIAGIDKWNEYIRYYYALRKTMRFTEIARNLHVDPVRLRLRLFGMQVFYKLYSK